MSSHDAIEKYFTAAIEARKSDLANATGLFKVAQERWNNIVAQVFRKPAAAVENIHRSFDNRGVNETLNLIEWSGIHDPARGWIDVKNEIGAMRTIDGEDNEAERAIYMIRDTWNALQQQARVVDKAEQALNLVVQERDRRLAELVRLREQDDVRANDRQMSVGAESASRVDVHGHARKSRGA